MRPALLRLLKRPSAVSILDVLVAAPFGIEQLGSKQECIRCRARRAHQGVAAYERIPISSADSELSRNQTRTESKSPFKLRVHDLDSPRTRQPPTTAYGIDKRDGASAVQGPTTNWVLVPENLEYESDVGHSQDIGSRLVDDPNHQQDFALWEELLRYRQRHYGEKGTIDIWAGLTVRLTEVELPVDGERADLFWQSFVDVGLKQEGFLNDLADYAFQLWKKSGKRWDKFYEAVVGGFFERGLPRQAVQWHKKLQQFQLSHPNGITRIVERALLCNPRPVTDRLSSWTEDRTRNSRVGLRAFQDICRSTEGHSVYDIVISTLMKHGRADNALLMHDFLVRRHDHPRSIEEVQTLFEYAEQFQPPATFVKLRTYVDHRFGQVLKARDQQRLVENSETAEAGEGRPLERPFKDEFGARLFATKALTSDMVVSGLRMFGVSAVGPQSLREMALRAHGAQDILDKIKDLQNAGISVGDSVFSRVVRRLASENRDIVLYDVLHSDQHPDVLEDADTQEALLVSYYMARDWRQYNMTLAILVELSEEGPDLFNIHFRKHITVGEWAAASRIVDEMTIHKKMISDYSINFMVQEVLTPRRKGVAPVTKRRLHPVDEVGFLTRTLQRVAESGGTVVPEIWIEALKRLGMKNRWSDLQTLCLWLARHYSSREKAAMTRWLPLSVSDAETGGKTGDRPVPTDRMLQTIFNPRMQMAIIAWGFRLRPSSKPDTKIYNPFGVEGESLVPWVRGLVLLRELERKGMRLRHGEIRRACRHRLAVLFGRPRHSSRRMNRLLRRENPYDVERVIGDIRRVWGPSLFRDQERHDLQGLLNPRSCKMSLRRTQRLVWRERHCRGTAFIRSR